MAWIRSLGTIALGQRFDSIVNRRIRVLDMHQDIGISRTREALGRSSGEAER